MSETTPINGHEEPLVPDPLEAHDPAGPAAEASLNDPEALAADNLRLASDLHTLLAGFPPGPTREVMMRQFPELSQAEEFSVARTITTPEADPRDQHVLLSQLSARAEYLVGGREYAETILRYPGITLGPALLRVRPARPEWVEASETANKLGPQMDPVISTKVGKRVFGDISAGLASWDDVASGYLDKDQIATQKELVAKLHSAFRSNPAMPSGHSHLSTLYTIPDARFGHLWRAVSASPVKMGRVVADWVERSEGVSLPPAPELSDDEEETNMDPANADRLNALFSDERFKPYVDTFIKLYTAAEDAIDSDEGRALLKDHRHGLSTKWAGGVSFIDSATRVKNLVRRSVRQTIEEIGLSSDLVLPSNLEGVFISRLDDSEEQVPLRYYPRPPEEV